MLTTHRRHRDVGRGAAHKPYRSTLATRDILLRIECEYREMPGLSLTLRQAQRLWHLDRETCARVLGTLVERGLLMRTRRGTYVRARPAAGLEA